MPTLPCTGGSHTAQEWQKFDQAILAAALEDVTGIQHWVIEDGRDHGEPDKQRAVLRSNGYLVRLHGSQLAVIRRLSSSPRLKPSSTPQTLVTCFRRRSCSLLPARPPRSFKTPPSSTLSRLQPLLGLLASCQVQRPAWSLPLG